MDPLVSAEIGFLNEAIRDLIAGKTNKSFLEYQFSDNNNSDLVELIHSVKTLITKFDENKKYSNTLAEGKFHPAVPDKNPLAEQIKPLHEQIKSVFLNAQNLYGIPYDPSKNKFDVLNQLLIKLNIKIKNLEKNHPTIEEHLNYLIDSTPIPFMLIRLGDGVIQKRNKLCDELFLINSDEEKAISVADFLYIKNDQADFLEEISCLEIVKDKELILKRMDGTTLFASVTAFTAVVEDQKMIMLSIGDISEMKLHEEERERLLEELEISKQQIEEEACKFIQMNIQLAESEEKLRELNAAKDKFFSIIGHDLKNPFHVIHGISEILVEDYNNLSEDEKLQFIHSIGDASRSAYRLLENLLAWARSQTGRIEFKPEPVLLRKICVSVIQLLEAQSVKKNITIHMEISPTYIVNADKNMLETIIRNLTSNCIKFTEEGGSIKIDAVLEGSFVVITVADSGCGIASQDISKLFRIDVNHTEIGNSREKGTGLGLILCKEFVEKHEGKIWVESELGVGSKFKFTLPLMKSHD